MDLYTLQCFIYILYDFAEILNFGKVFFKQNKNGSHSLHFLLLMFGLLPSCTAVLLTCIIPGWFSFLCNCFLSICTYPVGNPVLKLLPTLGCILTLIFLLDLVTNYTFLFAWDVLGWLITEWIECTHKLRFDLIPLVTEISEYANWSYGTIWKSEQWMFFLDVRKMCLCTLLGLKYPFLPRHRVKPQFLSLDFCGSQRRVSCLFAAPRTHEIYKLQAL